VLEDQGDAHPSRRWWSSWWRPWGAAPARAIRWPTLPWAPP